jgi:hypothetical protein
MPCNAIKIINTISARHGNVSGFCVYRVCGSALALSLPSLGVSSLDWRAGGNAGAPIFRKALAMIDLEIDCRAFEKRAKELHGQIDQVPYALALAMNAAARNTRQALVQDTWPSHVTQRNTSFIGRALRTNFANKRNLQIEIYDSLGRAHLKLHDTGGDKTARSTFAIPVTGEIKRTAKGVAKSKRPHALVVNTPKRALRITNKGIFVGKGGRLHLMYSFKSSTGQPADVPFERDFRDAMTIELRTSFPAALSKAMSSRRS